MIQIQREVPDIFATTEEPTNSSLIPLIHNVISHHFLVKTMKNIKVENVLVVELDLLLEKNVEGLATIQTNLKAEEVCIF